jgi:phospholipid transport system substrate-binding protein
MNSSVMKRTVFGWLLGALLGFAPLASAQDIAPDALAKKVTDEVLTILRSDKDIQSGNTRKVYDLVEAKVLPHFNFPHMTQLAVGVPWRQANPAQQQSLTNEFRMLLVHTYANAFAQYRDQQIEYRPLKMQPADEKVTVQSRVKQAGGADPIDVNYNMEKTDQGWKVYDVVIAGISLVQNYRSTFASEIQKNGVDGLIASLSNKNKSLAQQTAKK